MRSRLNGRCGRCGRSGRRSSISSTRQDRRGSASVAVLLILVLFSLIIVTMVAGGAGDHHLAAGRIDGVRAFYAAEAGVNMALRELALKVDEDGDGGIGTISHDGNPATNPVLVGASVFVTSEVDGDMVTLRSRGAGRHANRVIKLLAENPSGDGEPIVMMAYGKDGNNRPAYRIWNAETDSWGGEAFANAIGDVPYWIVLRGDPNSQRFAMAVLGNDERLTVQIWDAAAGSWSPPFTATSDAGEKVSRVFDTAFEQVSGRLVIAYRRGSSNTIGFRTHDGSAWSSESTYSPNNKAPGWIGLVPRPGDDEMLFLSSTDGNGKHSQLATWNGSQYASPSWHLAGQNMSEHEHLAAGYTGTGHALAAYSGKAQVGYRTYDGSGKSWSKGGGMSSLGSRPHWNRLAAHPIDNEAVLATLTENKRVFVNVWNGSFWGSNLQVTASTGDNNRRGFDLAYEFATGRPLIFYDRNSSTLRYRIWNGTSWSGELNGPGGGGSPIWTVQARTGIVDGQVFAIWASDEPNIRTAVWNGSSFSAPLNLGKSSAPKEYEPFMIAVANASGAGGDGVALTVLAWGEAAP